MDLQAFIRQTKKIRKALDKKGMWWQIKPSTDRTTDELKFKLGDTEYTLIYFYEIEAYECRETEHPVVIIWSEYFKEAEANVLKLIKESL